MSYRRIFSLREFALCLVVLTNAFGLGVVILTTAMATSPALASIEAGGSENGAVGVTERVDQGGIGTDVNDATSDTTAPTSEALPGLSSGKEPASGQVSLLIGDAVATKATHIPEESSGGLSLVDATNDSLTQIPIDGNLVTAHDAGVVNEEGASSDSTPISISPPGPHSLSTTASLDPVEEPTTLAIAQNLLKTDYDELLESGLDAPSTIKEIDRMAESDRYGKFGRR